MLLALTCWKAKGPPQAGIPDLRQSRPPLHARPRRVLARGQAGIGRHRSRVLEACQVAGFRQNTTGGDAANPTNALQQLVLLAQLGMPIKMVSDLAQGVCNLLVEKCDVCGQRLGHRTRVVASGLAVGLGLAPELQGVEMTDQRTQLA